MEKNIKLFPIYRMFSFDLLFYYAISVLYITVTKGLTISHFALLSTVYAVCAIFAQIPATIIVDKLGYRNTLIIGNLCCVMWAVLYIISNSFILFSLGEVFVALGFALKGVAETPLLCCNLKQLNRQNELAKVESKGNAIYFIFEAFASVTAGYMFFINAYLPVICCGICSLIACILMLNFVKEPKNVEKFTIKEYFENTYTGFKYISKSNRLRALLIFCMVMSGVTSMCVIFMKTIFKSLQVSSTGFGYIYAILGIAAAIGSTFEAKIEQRHRNRTLAILIVIYLTLLGIVGIFNLLPISASVVISFCLICFTAQNYLKGAYRVIIKEYISRYASNRIRPKIMSLYYLTENLGYALLSSFVSLLLGNYEIGIAVIISTLLLFVITIIVLMYMNNKLGLNSETYGENDRLDKM